MGKAGTPCVCKILIAGGGLGGAATALAAARAGFQVALFERASAFGEAGAGIQLSPNATRILAQWDVLDAIRAVGAAPEKAEVRDGRSGRLLAKTPLGAVAERRYGFPYLHIHRARLLEILIAAAKAAGARLHLGADVMSMRVNPDGVAIAMAGGATEQGDILVGADGVRSRLRNFVVDKEAPEFTGALAWRGLIPASAVPEAPPGAQVWTGPGRHLVHYRIKGATEGQAELLNFVAVIDGEAPHDESWTQTGDVNDLRAAFAGFAPAVRAILREAQTPFVTALYQRPLPRRWNKGPIVLLGDACHAMPPFMAQGAAMAIEDASALTAALLRSPQSLSAALAAYQGARAQRVARVQAQSARNGWFYHLRSPFLRGPARMAVAAQDALAQKGRFDWLYGYRP